VADVVLRVTRSVKLVWDQLRARGPMTLDELRACVPDLGRRASLDYEVRRLRVAGAVQLHSQRSGRGRKPLNVWSACEGVTVEEDRPRAAHLEQALLQALAAGPQTTAALAEALGHLNPVRHRLRQLAARGLVVRLPGLGMLARWELASAGEEWVRPSERASTVRGLGSRRLALRDEEDDEWASA
jgi:hypothetical protein